MASSVPRDSTISPELRRFLDGLARDIDTLQGAVAAAPASASFVTVAAEAALSAERRLVAGTGISLTDAGAGSTLTVASTLASMTRLGAVAATSGATASITNIPACKLLLAAYHNISHNDAGNQTLRFALSTNNGSSYSAAQNMFSTAVAGAVSGSGVLAIMRMDQTSNFVFQSSFVGQILGGVEAVTSGTVNAIQWSFSAGSFDDAAGAFDLYYI